ncbi:MAG: cytochrome c biogenesis protein CcdA [Nitrospinota bacterium]
MVKIAKSFLLTLLIATVYGVPAHAQEAQYADMRIVLPKTEFAPGASYPILLEINVKEGYHINSKKPIQPTLIPTVATFSASDDRVAIGRTVYPEPEMKLFKFSPEKLAVYDGRVYLATSVTFNEGVDGDVTFTAKLKYQACNDEACFLPEKLEASSTLKIGSGGVDLEPGLFAKHAPDATSGGSIFDGLYGGSIGPMALLMVLLGGLALNLTPCVYPMIPVTVGYFSAANERPRRVTVAHALVYLLGMALMYSAIGTFAALSGALFGEFMQNSFVIMLLVAVMILLSLSMFGVYEIRMPAFLMNLSSKSYGGFLGTLFMGLTVGIIAAPCIGPFVIGLLTFVGERQDPFLGFILFFTLAIGIGLPLVVLAIFSGGISSLPRAGVWMEWVRKFFGIVLLGMAIYFAQPLLTQTAKNLLVILVSIGGGTYLLYAGKNIGGGLFNFFRFTLGIGIMVFGIWFVSSTEAAKAGLPFKDYTQTRFESAFKEKKPVLVDFSAEWCLPCKELFIYTFSDERVVALSDSFEPLVVDLTRVDDEKLAIKKKFDVFGVPTVILFDANGKEVDRFTGFIPAEEFLERLKKMGVKS